MSDEVGKVSLGLDLDEKPISKQISNISSSLVSTFQKSMSSVFKSLKGAGKAAIIPAPDVNTDAVKAKISDLTAVLDNINAKIEIQQRKLDGLKESYANTFNDAGKEKLQEKIVRTEGALLRLAQTSDKTAQSIWKLEDKLKHAGEAANRAEKPAQKLGSKLTQVNKPLKPLTANLNQAAKAATGVGTALGAAGQGMGRMFNPFANALKKVFILTTLYKMVKDFKAYVGSSLQTNAQFVASLNAIRTNLRVAFQPIYDAILPAINALMAWFAKATTYIAAFISALFGKTYKQSYAAAKGIETAKKSMHGYGKAAKKAGKEAKGSLASFDELNTIDLSKADADENDTADAGASGDKKDFEMSMPDMDIASIQSQMDAMANTVKSSFSSTWDHIKEGWMSLVRTFGPSFSAAWAEISPVLERWKAQFAKVYSDILTLGEPLKKWMQMGLIPNLQKGIKLAGHILAGLGDSGRKAFTSLWDSAFPILNKFVTKGLPRLSEFVSKAQDILRGLFDLVKDIFDDIWRDAVDPAMKLVSKIVCDTLDMIFNWWDKWGKKILDKLKESLDKIKKLWNDLWDVFLKPIITNLLNKLKELWDKHLKGLVQEVLNFVGKLATAALDIFNKFILPIVNWLVKKLGPVFSEILNLAINIVVGAAGTIADTAKGIIKALGGIVDFIAGAFTGNWKKAWSGIKTFCSGIFDSIGGLFKGVVNIIIDTFNWMIKQINKVKFKVPDWVPGIGGKQVGGNIPQIPKLAKGGLAYGPTLAMVGDNRGASVDPEVVSPLSKLQGMLGANNQPVVDVLTMILDALRSNDKQTVLQIGETEFGRIAIKAINNAQRQAGRNLLHV